MKTKRQQYDTRNAFQKVADKKKVQHACMVVAAVAFVLSICLAVLAFTGQLGGDTIANNNTISHNEYEADATLWQAPTSSPSTIPSVNPSIFPSPVPSSSPSSKPSSQPSTVPTATPSSQPSLSPSSSPSTSFPSGLPSASPTTSSPSELPSLSPSVSPTLVPSLSPSVSPTLTPPSEEPSSDPTAAPSLPSDEPSADPTAGPSLSIVSYEPGNLSVFQENIHLSKGLQARLLAKKNLPVQLANGGSSNLNFHGRPDFGATFAVSDGGWVYVSNSEMEPAGTGGVGAIRFDSAGNVLSYDMILTGTTMNCGGGRTPWGSWISCEEIIPGGQIYQVDPLNQRPAAALTMGLAGGRWESFSFDVRDSEVPRFFVTEDHPKGAVRRFTPLNPDWNDPWTMLHGDGALEFLVLDYPTGTFSWTTDLNTGRNSALAYYPDCEGIDVNDGVLYVVSKSIRQLYILDLDALTYVNTTTRSGLFEGKPDQVKRILGDDEDMLYFTEEGGRDPGVHGRDAASGRYFTILEGENNDETTGLSFSPNGKFMYVAFQELGLLYEISREDGFPFHGRSLNVQYHSQATAASRRVRAINKHQY